MIVETNQFYFQGDDESDAHARAVIEAREDLMAELFPGTQDTSLGSGVYLWLVRPGSKTAISYLNDTEYLEEEVPVIVPNMSARSSFRDLIDNEDYLLTDEQYDALTTWAGLEERRAVERYLLDLMYVEVDVPYADE